VLGLMRANMPSLAALSYGDEIVECRERLKQG
jgi:hypothetical protein